MTAMERAQRLNRVETGLWPAAFYSLSRSSRLLPAVQYAPNDAKIAIDLVVDRVRKSPREHAMVTPHLEMNASVENQGVDIGKKGIEEVFAELLAMFGVERSATIKVFECGRQDPQLHELLSEFAFRRRPLHRLLGAGLVSLLGLFQGLLVPVR